MQLLVLLVTSLANLTTCSTVNARCLCTTVFGRAMTGALNVNTLRSAPLFD